MTAHGNRMGFADWAHVLQKALRVNYTIGVLAGVDRSTSRAAAALEGYASQ